MIEFENFFFHDKYRFEIKLNLDRSEKYNIEYYFFVPSSLNVSYYTYSKEKFYSSIQRYIRYQSPDIPLKEIFNPSNLYSPYNRAIKLLDDIKLDSNNKFLEETFIDEVKLFGSIIKDEINRIYNKLSENVNNINDFLVNYEMINYGLANLRKKISSFNYNSNIINSYRCLDEYIRLLEEETLIDIIYTYKNNISNDIYEKIKNKIEEINKHRKIENYLIFSDENSDFFLYRKGLLKKFISSCLFLNIEPAFNIYYHIISGIASALAMLFAVIVMIYAQMKYSTTSMFFVLIAVVSYVFKDRIKEFVKIVFSKKSGNLIYDRKISIKEPTHNINIGNIKETFSIVSPNDLDDEILSIRNKDNINIIDEDAKIEVVLKYRKIIKLDYDKIEKYHDRRKNLINIMRFSIQDFLKHTDDEYVDYSIFKNNNIEFIKARRTYHINVVVRYSMDNMKLSYERYRIIFNRSGIIKIDKVV